MTKQEKETVKQANKQSTQARSTQTFLKISEIRDDTVILKNGGLRAVIKVSSINFNLKSEDEQNAIIYSYQSFLNTLEFPIQIVVRSKKLDIDDYIDSLREKGDKQKNKLLQQQTYEYIEYISKLVEYADIMEKEFYVVVPYNPYRAEKQNMLQKFFQNLHPKDTVSEIKRKHREFNQLKKKLTQRVNTVKIGLENTGLKTETLNSNQLVELFYNIYNPITSRYQKSKNISELNIKHDEEIAALDQD